jgi:hypothetical protein
MTVGVTVKPPEDFRADIQVLMLELAPERREERVEVVEVLKERNQRRRSKLLLTRMSIAGERVCFTPEGG